MRLNTTHVEFEAATASKLDHDDSMLLCEPIDPAPAATTAFNFVLRGCPCCAALPTIAAGAAFDPPPLFGVPLVDTHNHVHKQAREVRESQPTKSYSAVLAVDEACWDTVLERCAEDPLAAPGLGIHPWCVHELMPGWAERLRAKLVEHPGALVGEIGLCKCARNLRGAGEKKRVWPLQMEAFTTQLAIGGELRRPASVHCVKAHSKLLELLQEPPTALPPAIALHSFSGTAHDVKQLLALRVAGPLLFFGFSYTVNVAMGGAPGSAAHDALLQAIRAVPRERLLVESDCDSEAKAADALRRAIQLVADARGWTPEEAAQLTTANGMRFLQSGACGPTRAVAHSRAEAGVTSSDDHGLTWPSASDAHSPPIATIEWRWRYLQAMHA